MYAMWMYAIVVMHRKQCSCVQRSGNDSCINRCELSEDTNNEKEGFALCGVEL